jgi:hypothetical protein
MAWLKSGLLPGGRRQCDVRQRMQRRMRASASNAPFSLQYSVNCVGHQAHSVSVLRV